ncbi:glycogen debranching N-terminal domain-containing protein [Micromonospora sp. WMMD1082]|uniref:amylo-alpha-1,6-glucosidase n=1 Tax=Micromonospora sp. WMMD1082 TaxID=3016104 RepID=UPI0024174218|nr:glycogen debranching N-terminal domain-containing protein [Micromonospora sp. WMMD1082]MDG4795708.1 glycogen debranching N-terminal domain-containing protein [Micromonospora sp. WMMD1082]
MREETVSILDSNTFAVSSMNGDMEASDTFPTGMFAFDTRFLSKWRLTAERQPLEPLSVDTLQHSRARFFLVPARFSSCIEAKISIIRDRLIGHSMAEELTVLNHGSEPVELTMHLEVDSDFADIFEIKNIQPRKSGRCFVEVGRGRLKIGYEREAFLRETLITTSTAAEVGESGFKFIVRIDPYGTWTTRLHVEPLGKNEQNIRGSLQGKCGHSGPDAQEDHQRWVSSMPRLETEDEALKVTYHRCLDDLAALRYTPIISAGQRAMPAAGLPWFMTVFGRDAILTSLQVLPFTPEFAWTTLQQLGVLQGSRLDDFRDEEPGKIPHEFRFGESAAFADQPHTPYYGTVDATPLYVVLLDEYERWSGDAAMVRQCEGFARAALEWIDEYGDLRGNGYLWYQCRSKPNGLENQCWKDSPDSISYRDGRLPGLPRATCEVQGYAYDAKRRGARLAREFWNDPDLADRLERESAELKERFNSDFWVDDGGYFALALDPDGNQVDALSSNIGHLLWSGIVDESKAASIVEHLLGPRLFSGWGVRTLAEGQGRYNPVGYHVGTVWPFDNSFIAWGLRRYGFKAEAARIAEAILDAAEFFQGRLPEAFGGYPRKLTHYPVEYPTACSPQAWSTGAPLLLLRTMLGIEPRGDHLLVDPAVPQKLGRIELLDIPGRWGTADAFGRGHY